MCLEQAVTIHALLNENMCPYHLLGYNEGMSNIFFFQILLKSKCDIRTSNILTCSSKLSKPDALNRIFVTLNVFLDTFYSY